MKEYTGEERRHGERITKLEVQIEGLGSIRDELGKTREEMNAFRHDLFDLLNPLKDMVAKHENQLNDREEGLAAKAQRASHRISNLEHWRTGIAWAYAASVIFVMGVWAVFKEKIQRIVSHV